MKEARVGLSFKVTAGADEGRTSQHGKEGARRGGLQSACVKAVECAPRVNTIITQVTCQKCRLLGPTLGL